MFSVSSSPLSFVTYLPPDFISFYSTAIKNWCSPRQSYGFAGCAHHQCSVAVVAVGCIHCFRCSFFYILCIQDNAFLASKSDIFSCSFNIFTRMTLLQYLHGTDFSRVQEVHRCYLSLPNVAHLLLLQPLANSNVAITIVFQLLFYAFYSG